MHVSKAISVVAVFAGLSLLPPSAHGNSQTLSTCEMSAKKPTNFYVSHRGHIGDQGREAEGPVRICIFYNALRFDIETVVKTTYAAGPDIGTPVVTGVLKFNGIDVPALLKLQSGLIDRIQDMVITADVPFDTQATLNSALLLNKYVRFSDALHAAIEAFNHLAPVTGADYEKVVAQQKVIVRWNERFERLGLNSTSKAVSQPADCKTNASDPICGQLAEITAGFEVGIDISCGNVFNRSSKTAVSFTVYDQTPTLELKPESAVTSADSTFTTVTCSSPFAVSAGVEFSTIPKREFAIVQSPGDTAGTVKNTFGLLGESNFHPLPLALTHYRLHEWKNHVYGAHFSAGASGNLQGQSSGGSSAEFIVGPSFSFARAIFLTGGAHIGTESSIAGGFHVGDTVPAGVTTIQVRKDYVPGFGFAITFSKP